MRNLVLSLPALLRRLFSRFKQLEPIESSSYEKPRLKKRGGRWCCACPQFYGEGESLIEAYRAWSAAIRETATYDAATC